jgi:hypothetical protein
VRLPGGEWTRTEIVVWMHDVVSSWLTFVHGAGAEWWVIAWSHSACQGCVCVHCALCAWCAYLDAHTVGTRRDICAHERSASLRSAISANMDVMQSESTGGGAYKFKVVLLGEGRVGKTSIVLRYCQNQFSDSQVSTLQVCACSLTSGCDHALILDRLSRLAQASFLSKKINIGGKRVQLDVWVRVGEVRLSGGSCDWFAIGYCWPGALPRTGSDLLPR